MFDRFRSLSTRQQVQLIGAALCAACIVFGLAWFFLLRTVYLPLFGGLRPADAATIVAELESKKIPYRLDNGGTTILVPADLADRTRLSVMTQDLPLKGTVGFELFNKSDMGLTDFAQKINYQRALQGELERTIMTLDGIDTARVHLSLGEDRIFRDDRVPPKASVTIRMRQGFTLAASAAQGIQRLIAASVPNLDNSNVVILDEKGRMVGAPARPQAVPEPTTPFAQEKRAIELYYEARARQALEQSSARDTVAVAVSADLSALHDVHADSTALLADWNPAARNFPLQVTLSPDAVLDAASRETLRNLVAGAIGFNATKSDVIVFGAADDGARASPVADAPPARALPIPELPILAADADGTRGWPMAISLAAALMFVLAGFFVLVRQLRRRRRLSQRQRVDFASKLRTALDQGGRHVVSRS